MKKFIALFLTVLVGSFAFADTAAQNYLSHFESLVTKVEADAKSKNTANVSSYESQKQTIDAERATVTLSLTQRFTDWRYTGRYDSAITKLKGYSAKDGASTKVGEVKEKAGEVKDAAKEKAGEVKDAAKEKASETVESAKDSLNKKAEELENAADKKIEEKKGQISEKISEKAEEIDRAAKEKAEKAKETANEKAQTANSKVGGFFDRLFGKKDKEESK